MFTVFSCTCLRRLVQKTIAKTNVTAYCLCFILGVFGFRSYTQVFNQFEFISVCGIGHWSSFILLYVAVHFSQCYLLRRLPSPHCPFCHRLIYHIYAYVHFWSLYAIPLIYVSVFMPVPYSFDYCGFLVQLEIRKCDDSCFVFLSQDSFGYMRSLWLHTNFRIICSSSVKNTIGINETIKLFVLPITTRTDK